MWHSAARLCWSRAGATRDLWRRIRNPGGARLLLGRLELASITADKMFQSFDRNCDARGEANGLPRGLDAANLRDIPYQHVKPLA